MTLNAAFINTGLHYYFRWLDGKFSGTAASTVWKKLAIDQLVIAPASLAFFMSAAVYGHSWSFDEVQVKLKVDYFSMLQANYMVWPLANYFNFKYIPSTYRILYVASLGVIWNAYLSYVTNRDLSPSPQLADKANSPPPQTREHSEGALEAQD